MEKVRLGFVGVGGMGQCAHLRNFATLADCAVVALAELRPGLAKAVAARYGVPKVYMDHRELLKGETLDGIVAIQRFDVHGSLLPDLYEAGKPLLTEKALAGTVEAGRKLVEQERKSGALHLVGYHKRSDPATVAAVEEIRRLKQTGELGAMRSVRITMPPGDWAANGFVDLIGTDEPYPKVSTDPIPNGSTPEEMKCYVHFVNYYIHQVNLMRHLLGESYEVSYADPKGLVMVVHSASGIVGTLEMATYYTTLDWQESALITFDHGWIRLELPAPMTRHRPGRVTFFRDPGGDAQPLETRPDLPWVDAMRQQAIHFIKEIKGEKTCLCRADEALEDLEVAKSYLEKRGDA